MKPTVYYYLYQETGAISKLLKLHLLYHKKITSCTLKIIEHQDLNKHLGTRKAKQIGKIKLGCWISEFGKI